jgi:membrane-associated protein
MDFIYSCWDFLANFRSYITGWERDIGPGGLYSILFAIIFAETGLVVTPVLPGDSLLFFLGTRTADEASPLKFWPLLVLLTIAAIIGDAVNYWVGKLIGPKVFSRENSWLLNKKHLLKTQRFYEKYGAKTIILARFVPFARTFAPFVAGIGQMNYSRFALYNVVGGILWVGSLVTIGNLFGKNEFVEKNFSLVILAIVFISVLPIILEMFLAWRRKGTDNPPSVSNPEPATVVNEAVVKEVA